MSLQTNNPYSGRLFEEECLFHRNRLPPNPAIVPEQSFRDAILDCLRHPQYRPHEVSDPPALWMGEIHFLIAQQLGLRDYTALKVFPTLHTSADKHHKTDFVITYRDPDTHKEVILTADLTTNKSKSASYNGADIVIYPDGAEAHERYQHLGSGRSFHLPESRHATKGELKEWQAEIHRQTASLLANIIRAKLEFGERKQYQGLYSARGKLIFDARAAISDVLRPKLRNATPVPRAEVATQPT